MMRHSVHRLRGGWHASLSVLLGALLAGCGPRESENVVTPSTPPSSPVLARVGDQVVTAEDALREVHRRQAARRAVPSKDALVRELASMLALSARARAVGLDRDPEIAREVNALLAKRFLEREMAARLDGSAELTASEIEAEYQRTMGKYSQPALSRLALLFLEAPKNATEGSRRELKERLETVRQETVRRGDRAADVLARGFGAAAVNASDDVSSRHRGGDLGWLEDGNYSYRWPREVLQAAYALDLGGVSDVVEAGNGFYLVMKTDERRANAKALADVEAQIRGSLEMARRQTAESELRREVSDQYPVHIDEEALAALQVPEPVAQRVPRRGAGPVPELSHFEPPRH